eukprot:COSAG06_NODE_549_length_14405_cov_6.391933_8_plen_35_part_00
MCNELILKTKLYLIRPLLKVYLQSKDKSDDDDNK